MVTCLLGYLGLVAWLFGYLVTWLFFTWLLGCLLHGYLVAWFLGYLGTWLFDCLVTWLIGWLHGCLVAFLFVCLVTCLLDYLVFG